MNYFEVVRFVALGLLLLFSAFFSGTETALFSLSSLEREALRTRTKPLVRRVVNRILTSQEEVLISILTGNMLVNVFSSAIGGNIGSEIFPGQSAIFSIIVMTVLLLLVGEMTPKNIAVRHAVEFSRFATVPIFFVHRAVSPLRWALKRISDAVISLFPTGFEDGDSKTGSQVLSAVQLGYRRNMLDDSELHLFESYFDFREKEAHEVMEPRNQLMALPAQTTVGELLVLLDAGTCPRIGSFVLICKEDMDHLVGYIKPTDLLPHRYGNGVDERVTKIMKEFHVVPEMKDLSELIVEMRANNAEVALLVDEYGGTAGVVTFQHLIEDLLGHFFPSKNGNPKKIGDSVFSISGGTPVSELETLLTVEIDTESNTVAGLVMDLLGEIPVPGTVVETDELKFIIKAVDGNTVTDLQVERKKV